MSEQTETVPAQQGDDYRVGPGCPPKEHQFKPGQSGNPAGSPRPRTNLYKHISKYSGMTDAELAQLDLESLTQSEKAALRMVQDMAAGKHTGAEGLAKYIIDRDEGKVADRHIVDTGTSPWEKYKAWRDGLAEQGRKSIEAALERSESSEAL